MHFYFEFWNVLCAKCDSKQNNMIRVYKIILNGWIKMTWTMFASFQCWLQMVVFHLKGDFLSYFLLILIILSLSLWVLYYIEKLWYAHFWTSLGCSSYATNENLIYSNHLYEFVTQTWLECTEKWTGSPFLHLLPPDDLAH